MTEDIFDKIKEYDQSQKENFEKYQQIVCAVKVFYQKLEKNQINEKQFIELVGSYLHHLKIN